MTERINETGTTDAEAEIDPLEDTRPFTPEEIVELGLEIAIKEMRQSEESQR